jgi:hypothetical protein
MENAFTSWKKAGAKIAILDPPSSILGYAAQITNGVVTTSAPGGY